MLLEAWLTRPQRLRDGLAALDLRRGSWKLAVAVRHAQPDRDIVVGGKPKAASTLLHTSLRESLMETASKRTPCARTTRPKTGVKEEPARGRGSEEEQLESFAASVNTVIN